MSEDALEELTPSDLDTLMSLDPLELTSSPAKLDAIIAYMRRARAMFAAGVKPVKGSGKKIDLKELGMVKPAANVLRRI